MKRNQASRTAESSAAQRALHTLHAHDPKVFEDRFALDLAGRRWKWLIGTSLAALLFQRLCSWLMPMVAHHLARSRYVEERLDQMVDEGLAQYVLLGAGMDSFSLRRSDLAQRLVVYEVDHPASQTLKRARLLKMGHGQPTFQRYVPVDFERDSLTEALADSGLNAGKPALFAWMGVMPYLTEDSIRKTFEDVRRSAATGSEIVFDTLDRAALTRGRLTRVGAKMFGITEKWGEPMISGFDPDELGEILGRAGLSIVEVVTPEAFTSRWFQHREDGLAPWEHMYVVRARID